MELLMKNIHMCRQAKQAETQITLDEWVQLKENLKRDLVGVQESFVRIGYTLRKIEEEKLYEQDGYKSVAEFAKAELGLEASTTSRFISINREYSADGYSEILSPEYAELGRSQLEEMLKLPEAFRFENCEYHEQFARIYKEFVF